MNHEQNHNISHHGDTCNCCCCGHGSMGIGRYVVARWILGILLLAFVFVLGMKIGMFKSEIRHMYGDHRGGMMMQQGGYYR